MASNQPLAGITVVEIGHSVAAPFAGMIFGMLGARVVKVESPGHGDHARGWGPPFWNGTATTYMPLNRDKLGVAVDLGDPAQAERLRSFILDETDVVIQNLRDGVVERFGLGADELRSLKPELIVCNIGASGGAGPLNGKPGYDPLMQAFSGLMSVTGEVDRPPVRVGVSLVDMGSGMWSVIGILAALLERATTKSGCTIDTSLFETAAAWMTVHLAACESSGEVRKPHGSGLAEIVPYQAFSTRTGWLMIAAGNDGLFVKLCRALGLTDLLDDARFRTNADRVGNRDVLLARLEAEISARDRETLAEELDAFGVPNAPLNSVDTMLRHPQLEATGILQTAPDGGLRTIGLPLRFDGVRPPFRRAAPRLGEHNEAVLGLRQETGIDDAL